MIISEILLAIERSDFFCADITGLNQNVLFELGFAIGKGKRIWITQDTTIVNSFTLFKELNLLTSIGYQSYTNSSDIHTSFLSKREYLKNSNLLDNYLTSQKDKPNTHTLFYLKSQVETNYNQLILNLIGEYKFNTIIDDASEVKVQPFSWYIEHLLTVPAVLVEFSSTYRQGFELQNPKAALIAGIALGLGLKVQMISEKPHPTDLDYQEYLKKFTSVDTCKDSVISFFNDIRANIVDLINKKNDRLNQPKKKETPLQSIRFGEFIAEHESSSVIDYYLDRAHDTTLVKSEYNIVVGRKGCGKTATLYYLESKYHADVRNEVVSIKPVNFEIDGLVKLISQLGGDFEKGFLIQSIWKFLIYTEIIKVIYEKIRLKPLYAMDNVDKEIIEYVDSNTNIILTDFSTRLEQEIISLESIININEQTAFRNKISEILHEEVIGNLKSMVIKFMNKRHKLLILIDNLDKNWRKGANIEIVSRFILGLLGVIGRISKELKGSPNKPNKFDLSLIVFLRSDIFRHIISFAREPDKIEHYHLLWSDPEILLRVVNLRIETLSKIRNSDEFWNDYITKNIDGIETKKYIISCIIPRPRDIIYFLNAAKTTAIARGHKIIESEDIVAAYQDYSNWVFKSLLVENGVTVEQIHTFLYKVMGESSIIERDRIEELMKESGISAEQYSIDKFIDHLCSLSFLGRETKPSNFEFEFDPSQYDKNKALADKFDSKRYKIHNAFMPYLECSDYVQ